MTSFWKNFFHSDSVNALQVSQPNWSWNEPWCGPQFDLVIMQSTQVENITHLLNISAKRVLTASRNGILCVWDIEENYSQAMPRVHQNLITTITLISEFPHHTAQQCITAALDRKIIVWSLVELSVLVEINNREHIVRSLSYVSSINLFLSGSNVLQLWSMKGQVLDCIQGHFENEDVRFILPIGDNKFVCAFDKYLSVYKISSIEKKIQSPNQDIDSSMFSDELIDSQFELIQVTKLPHHNEIIKVLIEVNDSAFISASLDGAIILWTSFRLNFTKCFNMRQSYVDSAQRFSFSVQDVSVIDQSFILAAIGNGFSVFDMNSGLTLADVEEAHDTKVISVRYLRWLDLIATCAFDGRIRLWGFSKKQLVESKVSQSRKNLISSSSLTVGKVFLRAPLSDVLKCCDRRNKERNYQIVCFHELLGHEDQVINFINMDVKGFLTYGRECCIFYWRNRDHFENELLNKIHSVF